MGLSAPLLLLLPLLAPTLSAPSVPELTPEVKVARDEFLARFTEAEAGKHAELAPVNTDTQAAQISAAYIADTKDVAEAKASHLNAFKVAKEGGLALLQPVQP